MGIFFLICSIILFFYLCSKSIPVVTPKETQEELNNALNNKREAFNLRITGGFKKATEDLYPKYVFIDFETSDLPYDYSLPKKITLQYYPHAVQVAAIIFNENGEQIDEYASIIKPPDECIISRGSIQIHRITKEKAEAQGVCIDVFLQFISKYLRPETILVAHNVQFDYLMLRVEAMRFNIKFPAIQKFCTMKGTTHYCGIYKSYGRGYKWPKLSELVDHTFFNGQNIRNVMNYHDADSDVKYTAHCFFELKNKNYISV
ncbi:MAG: 3'-5' exonuclease [Daejeonella sp.]